MGIERSTDGKFVIWRYDRLRVLGILGILERQLDELEELFKDKSQIFEFAPVKKELGRDFLAAFYLDPPIDFTVVRNLSGESSIVTYSLDEDKSREIIDSFVERSGFIPRKPDPDFVETIETEFFYLERITYENCLGASVAENIDLERIFGAVRYANFLYSYRKIPFPDSRKKAHEKFGLEKYL
jgi:hypothetical protein